MKKIIFTFIISLIFTSCATLLGPDYAQLTKQLELGMSQRQTTDILGNNYFIESAIETPDGKMEVLHFRYGNGPDYVLCFLDGRLTEFHRYIPPCQDVRVIKEEKK